MRRFARILVSASLLAGLSTGVAAAQSNITNTGPNSNNTITNNTSNSTKIVCINNSLITSNNTQTSTSGSASNSGNTTGGSATSGSASNSSNVTTTVNGSCPKGTTSAPAGSPAVQAAQGGRGGLSFDTHGNLISQGGGGQGGGVVLPATGTADTVKAAVVATIGLVGAAALGQLGFNAYRRRALNQ